MSFFEMHGLKDLNDHDAFFDLFYDEDLRFEYLLAFNKFTRCLNLVFPAKEALDFMPDYQRLSEINVLAGNHLRDARLSMKGIPPKRRGITDAFLESRGIDLKVAPISILDQDFERQVGKRKRNKTKAAEVEHAIRHHLGCGPEG
jgi:type I restriction enzyme, R subunit